MFLNREEIVKRVYDCEGITDIKVLDTKIEAYDEREDMFLEFRFLESINYNELFDFKSLEVNMEKFTDILKNELDPTLFLMPKKVYFVSNEEELDALEEEYESQSMDFEKNLGINWSADSVIVINVYRIKKDAKETMVFGESLKDSFNRIMWETIIHELRHMVCDIGFIVYDNEIAIDEGNEENVEKYCISEFENSIEYNPNHKCFKFQ